MQNINQIILHYAFCILHYYIFADVAELADALVSGSSEEIRVGSNPVIRTKNRQVSTEACRFLLLHSSLFTLHSSLFTKISLSIFGK